MSFSENFINIMDAVGKQLGIAVDWTSQNVAPYLEQLSHRIVTYEISMSVFYIIICIISAVIGRNIFKIGKRMFDDEGDEFGIFPLVIGFIILVGAIMAMGEYSKDVITALTLPEKTIIEFIMQYK